jgi:hypothetical protein
MLLIPLHCTQLGKLSTPAGWLLLYQPMQIFIVRHCSLVALDVETHNIWLRRRGPFVNDDVRNHCGHAHCNE